MAEKTGCRSRMESTFKNNYELASNTKTIQKDCSSTEEHAENMGVLYLQFSHLTRINEQLLELNLALRSCKINYIHITNLSGPNYYTDCKKIYTHTMPEKMLNRSTYIFHSMSERLFKKVRVIEVLQSIRIILQLFKR